MKLMKEVSSLSSPLKTAKALTERHLRRARGGREVISDSEKEDDMDHD
jgi:hypothetical protein